MAEVHLTRESLNVVLSPWEKVAALHRDLRLPLAAVTDVDVVADPLAEVTGVRAPGLHLPRRSKIGTWRSRGRRIFAVAHANEPALRIGLAGAGYDAVIVSVPHAAAVAGRLRTALATP